MLPDIRILQAAIDKNKEEQAVAKLSSDKSAVIAAIDSVLVPSLKNAVAEIITGKSSRSYWKDRVTASGIVIDSLTLLGIQQHYADLMPGYVVTVSSKLDQYTMHVQFSER
jgi:hypothetical protein